MSTEIEKDQKPVTKLVIDRRFWYRGQGSDQSRLLRADGSMCCLGFYGKACAISTEELLNVAYPRPGIDPEWPTWLFGTTGTMDYRSLLASVNDGQELSDSKREAEITKVFAKHGVEVEFVDMEPGQ